MGKLNKFETAAELDTKAKRELYLSKINELDLNMKEMTDYIDTARLAAECHPEELLLSKEWQKGFECHKLRMQKIMHNILEDILTKANTTLDAAAKLSIGGDVVDELSLHSVINENSRENLLNKLVKNADKVKADALCMYDPEIHPDSGNFIKKGRKKLYFWTDEALELNSEE